MQNLKAFLFIKSIMTCNDGKFQFKQPQMHFILKYDETNLCLLNYMVVPKGQRKPER